MEFRLTPHFDDSAQSVLFEGDCLDLLRSMPNQSVQLVVTSPPYNLGKEYEKRSSLARYIEWQSKIIRECWRILRPTGSICWQTGNFVEKGRITPLDIALYPVFSDLGMQLRNRIIWHFEHGLHCSRRLSGRYETILWFTKSEEYFFDLDPIRIPQKYPGKKYFKGPKAGEYSCNPLGKNPGDVWIIPNVKNNHVEKTDHPCQFPVELIERLVISLTQSGDWVVDPFVGTGTTIVAALRQGRRGVGAEITEKYLHLAKRRVKEAVLGTLKTRPMNTPVYDPAKAGKSLTSRVSNSRKTEPNQLSLVQGF
jgi:adenine-specific DNA-methyltransferase